MLDSIASIAQAIAQDDQAIRLRKLIFYVCYETWQGDVDALLAMDLAATVRTLAQKEPSFSQLKRRLPTVINTLSKPVEYAQIGDRLVHYLKNLYPDADASDATTIFSALEPCVIGETIDRLQLQFVITQRLDQHPKAERIKKLMLCVAQKVWQSDRAKLAQIETASLIEQLWRTYHSYATLQTALMQVVDRLSKPVEYQAISQIILEHMIALYPQQELISMESATTTINISSDLDFDERTTIVPARVTSITQETAEQFDYPIAPIASGPIAYDLRHEVMKYTNPLRSKLLLLSALQSTTEAAPSTPWEAVKHHSLDDLLQRFSQRYRQPVLVALKLREAAMALTNCDEYLQTVDALVRCLEGQYGYWQEAKLQAARLPEPIVSISNGR